MTDKIVVPIVTPASNDSPVDTPLAPASSDPLVSPAPVIPPAPEDEMVPIQRVRDLQSTADRLRNDVVARDTDLLSTKAALAAATEAYRIQVLAANPVVPGSLISGSTVAEIVASLASALSAVEHIRASLAVQVPPVLIVPAGAPARGPVDTSGMSAHDKIVHGLAQK